VDVLLSALVSSDLHEAAIKAAYHMWLKRRYNLLVYQKGGGGRADGEIKN
jgi:hypothetical protein